MSPRQPVVSGEQLIKALGRDGWKVVRQRGSHVRLNRETGAVRRIELLRFPAVTIGQTKEPPTRNYSQP